MDGNTILKLVRQHIPSNLNVRIYLCELSALHTIVPTQGITVVIVATRPTTPTHWCVLILSGLQGCFLDPLAAATPEPVQRLLSGCCLKSTFSTKPIQKHHSSCGHIVTYAACKLLRGLSQKKPLREQIELLNQSNQDKNAGIWLRNINNGD